jgi:hypothetical protein
MATYKKVSDYEVTETPNDDDLVPSIVINPDGSKRNRLFPYAVLKGPAGEDGSDGVGVPTGGTSGQVLKKNSSTDHDTSWGNLDKTAVGLSNVDNTSDANKPVSTAVQAAINAAVASAVAQSKQESYPIGSLYFNADDATNPATLLGFGTWVAHAQGQVPVGKATSGTFGTAGASVGVESYNMTQAMLVGHWHSIFLATNHGDGDYVGNQEALSAPMQYGGRRRYRSGTGIWPDSTSGFYGQNEINGTARTTPTTPLSTIQPSIVVYIWRRTA